MKEIIIKKIEEQDNNYIAYFKNPVLKITFSVCFTDSIVGAIGLNHFFQMLKSKYIKDDFEFNVSEEVQRFKHKELLKNLLEVKEEVK